MTEAELAAIVGRASGRSVHALANNRSPRRVRARGRRRSIGSQHALGRGAISFAALDAVLVGLVDRVARRMRTAGRAGRTVVLRLRFGDFSRATRSHTLSHPTVATTTILAVARALLDAAKPIIERRGITLLGLTVSNLAAGAIQLELELQARSDAALDAALDEVRERFGPQALVRASLLGRRRLAPDLLAGDS